MSEAHGRGVAANLLKLLGGKSVAGVLSVGYLLIVTRALGPEGFGVLVLVNAWATTVGGIIAFSGWHGIVRYGAQALEAGDRGRLVRLARFMTLVELGCGIAAILVAFLGAPLAARQLGWPPEIVPVAQIFSLAIIANMLTTPVGLLQLAGRFDRLGLHPALSPALRLAGTVFVWATSNSLSGYLLVWMGSAVAEGLLMWVLALPVIREFREGHRLVGPVRGVRDENDGLVKFLATTNADLTLRDLAPKAVPLIVGWALGPAAAGLYSLAQRAAVVLQQPAIQLAQAGYPVVAKLLAAGDQRGAMRLTWRTSAVALAIAVPVVVLLSLFPETLLRLLGGPGFEAGASLLVLLLVGRAALLAAVPLSSTLIALGRTTASITTNVAINLGSLPLLALGLQWIGLRAAGWHGLLTGIATFVVLAIVLRSGKSARARPYRTARSLQDG